MAPTSLNSNTSTSPFAFLDDLNVTIEPHALLSAYTTFRLGGRCQALITCATPEALISVVQRLATRKLRFLLIGWGSNIVASDQGIDAVIVRYFSTQPLIQQTGDDLIVSGSTELDALAMHAVNEGLEGVNFATGIPGTVGGAVVGNAGAFGKQVGDILKSVTLLDPDGQCREEPAAYCRFHYRHSRLKETGEIVVSARFSLRPGDSKSLTFERAEILKIRSEKHPDLTTHPCAGSFFRNVEPTSKAERRQAAGWFLEQCGGKSLKVGGAVIFDKHANIIVKAPGCTAQDVHDLSGLMQKAVKEKFNLDLVREVRFLGPFKDASASKQEGFW